MDAVYQWVENILFFLVFAHVANVLLPSKKYEKYIRFFAGIVVILLVMQPLTKPLHIDDRIAYFFESIRFKEDAQDLSRDILGIEEERLQKVLKEYEAETAKEVERMAAAAGVLPAAASVIIESDREKENYGRVTKVKIVLRQQDDGEEAGGSQAGMEGKTGDGEEARIEKERTVKAVNPVKVESIVVSKEDQKEKDRGEEKETKEGNNTEGEKDREEKKALTAEEEKEREKIQQLQRKVENYYGLEAKDVEIQVEGG